MRIGIGALFAFLSTLFAWLMKRRKR